MAYLDWNETRNIMNELEELFSRDDDTKEILDIKKMSTEIDIHFSSSVQDAKYIIKQLATRVASKEQEILGPSEATHTSQIKQLELENTLLANDIDMLRNDIENRNENILRLQSETIELQQANTPPQQKPPNDDARTAYALSLYSKISNISWNYNAPDGTLSGCIGSDQAMQVMSFQLNTQSSTPFELTNALWDLIGQHSDMGLGR